MTRRTILPLALASLAVFAVDASAADREVPRSSLRTVEGSVVSIGETSAEGSLPVVTVELEPRATEAERFTVLLAPRDVLDAIEFEVVEGDVVRVRIFVEPHGPAKAHRVMNLTRDTMVRLRTLHQVPLWDGRGEWSGGACRRPTGPGPRGPRNRGRR